MPGIAIDLIGGRKPSTLSSHWSALHWKSPSKSSNNKVPNMAAHDPISPERLLYGIDRISPKLSARCLMIRQVRAPTVAVIELWASNHC